MITLFSFKFGGNYFLSNCIIFSRLKRAQRQRVFSLELLLWSISHRKFLLASRCEATSLCRKRPRANSAASTIWHGLVPKSPARSPGWKNSGCHRCQRKSTSPMTRRDRRRRRPTRERQTALEHYIATWRGRRWVRTTSWRTAGRNCNRRCRSAWTSCARTWRTTRREHRRRRRHRRSAARRRGITVGKVAWLRGECSGQSEG